MAENGKNEPQSPMLQILRSRRIEAGLRKLAQEGSLPELTQRIQRILNNSPQSSRGRALKRFTGGQAKDEDFRHDK